VPLVRDYRRSLGRAALYGVLVASALPAWHDLLFGQVSALVTCLALAAFIAYERRRVVLAAVLLGVATSIKLYPGLFAILFVLHRDRRAVAAFLATVLAASGGLPLLVLGERGVLVFYAELWQNLQRLAAFTAATPFGNHAASAVCRLVTGRSDPASTLYGVAGAGGMLVAGLDVFLAFRLVRAESPGHRRRALMLLFAAIPFVVRPCWVHYFVFLPLVQLQALDGALTFPARWQRWAAVASVMTSAVLISVPLLLLVGDGAYYTSGAPFWATAVLLPVLYADSLRGPAGLAAR
jgi:alpha-1,2-mannosyltransferase